jgi:hypothetical protein
MTGAPGSDSYFVPRGPIFAGIDKTRAAVIRRTKQHIAILTVITTKRRKGGDASEEIARLAAKERYLAIGARAGMAPALIDVRRRGEIHFAIAGHVIGLRDVFLVDALGPSEIELAMNLKVVALLGVEIPLEFVERRIAAIADVGL